jgi:hypothetical protein
VPTARAWAFADDLVIHGYAELLDHVDDYKRLIRELTGMELCTHGCALEAVHQQMPAAVHPRKQ